MYSVLHANHSIHVSRQSAFVTYQSGSLREFFARYVSVRTEQVALYIHVGNFPRLDQSHQKHFTITVNSLHIMCAGSSLYTRRQFPKT